MSNERRLQELETRLQIMDTERVLLLREIPILREEISRATELTRPLLGRPSAALDLSTNTNKVPACANEWVKPFVKNPKSSVPTAIIRNF